MGHGVITIRKCGGNKLAHLEMGCANLWRDFVRRTDDVISGNGSEGRQRKKGTYSGTSLPSMNFSTNQMAERSSTAGLVKIG